MQSSQIPHDSDARAICLSCFWNGKRIQLGGGEIGIAEEATAPMEQPKPKRAYTKNGEMKAQLEQKLGEQAKPIR